MLTSLFLSKNCPLRIPLPESQQNLSKENLSNRQYHCNMI